MSVEIAWKQNILVTDFHLLKSLLVVFGFGSQAFVCGFSRQNINSVALYPIIGCPNLRLLDMQWVTVLSCSTVEKHKYHSAAVYHVLQINQTNTS